MIPEIRCAVSLRDPICTSYVPSVVRISQCLGHVSWRNLEMDNLALPPSVVANGDGHLEKKGRKVIKKDITVLLISIYYDSLVTFDLVRERKSFL